MRRTIAVVIGVLSLAAVAQAAEALTFTKLNGDETGTAAAFAKRKAEILAKRNGTLGSHDWWWWGLKAFDYDNDGDLDLIAGVHGVPFDTNGLLFRNEFKETGKVAFTDVTKETGIDGIVPSADQEAWVWDFDGDGWLDVFGTFNDTPTSCLFNRKGKFEKASFTNSGLAYPGGVADLNQDGHLDIWESNSKGRTELLYDPSSASFKVNRLPLQPPPVLPDKLQKELEGIAANEKQRNSKFSAKWNYQTGMDLNNDGITDLAVSAFASYGLGVCLGRYLVADKDGKFTEAEGSGLPAEGTPLFYGDLNGDGADDVLVIATATSGLYLNNGKGQFTLKPGPLTEYVKKKGPYPHRTFVTDFNRDGRPDLLVTGRRLANFALFLNEGEGSFSQALRDNGTWIDGAAICDLNNDGLLDLAVGCERDKEPRIEVFLNTCPNPGRHVDIFPRMAKPNWAAVGARIEVFKAGELGGKGSRPVWKEDAHMDATPVRVGLGTAATFDLRVTFPGKEPKVLELKGLEPKGKLTVTPEGVDAQ